MTPQQVAPPLQGEAVSVYIVTQLSCYMYVAIGAATSAHM